MSEALLKRAVRHAIDIRKAQMTRLDFDKKSRDKQLKRSVEARQLIEEARELLLRDVPKGGRTDQFCKRLDKWLKTKKTIRK